MSALVLCRRDRRGWRQGYSIEWTPPASGDPAVGRALARLVNHKVVEAANRKAYGAYLSSQPYSRALGRPNPRSRAWGDACFFTPVRRSPGRICAGRCKARSWARSSGRGGLRMTRARKLVESGAIRFEPCHDHGAVGPMAGIISPSMPVWIVRDGEHGHRTFSNLNEGLGKALQIRGQRGGGAGAAGVDGD